MADYPYESLRLECGCYKLETAHGFGELYYCPEHRNGKANYLPEYWLDAAERNCRNAGIILFRSLKPGERRGIALPGGAPMSSTLKWRPRYQKGHDLSDQLKYALRKRYTESGVICLAASDVPYLEGLRDAGVEDAGKLLEAIERYDEVEVWEQY